MVFRALSTLFSRYSQYAFSNTTSLTYKKREKKTITLPRFRQFQNLSLNTHSNQIVSSFVPQTEGFCDYVYFLKIHKTINFINRYEPIIEIIGN